MIGRHPTPARLLICALLQERVLTLSNFATTAVPKLQSVRHPSFITHHAFTCWPSWEATEILRARPITEAAA